VKAARGAKCSEPGGRSLASGAVWIELRARAPLASCVVAVCVAAALAGCSSGAPSGRTLHVSEHGTDSGSGSAVRPWRTLARAASALRPGDTLLVAPGTYGRRGTRLRIDRDGTSDNRITVRGEPGASRPRILGHVRIDGHHVRLDHLLIDGPTGPLLPRTAANPRGEEVEVWVRGHDVELSDCEVRQSAWHANGDPGQPSAANLDHGIYWDSGSGLVANNLIDHNVAFGIHLYRHPADVKVVHNTVVRNGRSGIILSAAASDVDVSSNIVAFNARPDLSFDLHGTGNSATGNLFWSNGGTGVTATDGIQVADNVVADPLFAGPDDFRPARGSPAGRRGLGAFGSR
jgi:hypothetical protein